MVTNGVNIKYRHNPVQPKNQKHKKSYRLNITYLLLYVSVATKLPKPATAELKKETTNPLIKLIIMVKLETKPTMVTLINADVIILSV